MMGWKILFPFRTTKVCSPNWDLSKYVQLCTKYKYLALMVQWQSYLILTQVVRV